MEDDGENENNGDENSDESDADSGTVAANGSENSGAADAQNEEILAHEVSQPQAESNKQVMVLNPGEFFPLVLQFNRKIPFSSLFAYSKCALTQLVNVPFS